MGSRTKKHKALELTRRERPACPFYGFNHVYGTLLDSRGNQCGLIRNSYSPCQMEISGNEPDWHKCYLNVGKNNRRLVGILDVKVLPNELKSKHPWSGIPLKDWMMRVMKRH